MTTNAHEPMLDSGSQNILCFILETLAASTPQKELPSDASQLSLRQLGISSLGALALQFRIDQRCSVRLPLETLLSEMSLTELANLLTVQAAHTEIL